MRKDVNMYDKRLTDILEPMFKGKLQSWQSQKKGDVLLVKAKLHKSYKAKVDDKVLPCKAILVFREEVHMKVYRKNGALVAEYPNYKKKGAYLELKMPFKPRAYLKRIEVKGNEVAIKSDNSIMPSIKLNVDQAKAFASNMKWM